jgi:hypothetical protein
LADGSKHHVVVPVVQPVCISLTAEFNIHSCELVCRGGMTAS